MNKSKIIVILTVVALSMVAIGLGLGYVLFDSESSKNEANTNQADTPLYYRNPMNPTIT